MEINTIAAGSSLVGGLIGYFIGYYVERRNWYPREFKLRSEIRALESRRWRHETTTTTERVRPNQTSADSGFTSGLAAGSSVSCDGGSTGSDGGSCM